MESDEKVVHSALGEDGVVGIIGMFLDEPAHPLGESESLT